MWESDGSQREISIKDIKLKQYVRKGEINQEETQKGRNKLVRDMFAREEATYLRSHGLSIESYF